MPVTCSRFEQFYNTRAAVVTGSLMVGERRGARPSDKNQVEPMPKNRRFARGDGQRPKICWRTLAISAPRMWKPAQRAASSRRS